MNFLSTLPKNLCIKRSELSREGYGVWSLEDIHIRTRFGPYKGKLVNSSTKQQCKGFQWKVERKEKVIMTLDGSEEKESNWLRYVNYARNKEEQNLIATQCHSEVYFITCKVIPANTQLFVWYKDRFLENRSNSKNEMSIKRNLDETENIACFPSIGRITQCEEKKANENLPSTYFLIQPTAPLYLMTCNTGLIILKAANSVPLFNSQSDNLVIAKSNASIQPGNDVSLLNSQNDTLIVTNPKISTQSVNRTLSFENESDKSFITNSKAPILQYKNQNNTLIIAESIMTTNRENSLAKTNKQYECKFCHKRYARNTLGRHERIHTGEKPHQCNICKKRFRTYSLLKSHHLSHSTHKPFKCEICQTSYKTEPLLKLHKLRHTGERAFGCKTCDRRFYENQQLKYHMRIHTGEKPYECKVCHKKFRQSKGLRRHRIVHTRERHYECQICHFRFALKGLLHRHERIHTGETPFECKICHKKFRFDSPFRKHMKIHAEKKYQCEICHKTFGNRSLSKRCCK